MLRVMDEAEVKRGCRELVGIRLPPLEWLVLRGGGCVR